MKNDARRPQRALIFIALLMLLPPSLARAATLTVAANGSGQYPTIQAAVNAAQGGDTILLADGTYSGAGNRDIDFGGRSLTVTSQNGAASTVINAGGSGHRGFYLHSGEVTAVFSGLTIENGSISNGSGGGIDSISTNVTVQNCTLSGNSATQEGGGIYNGYGTTTLTDCTLTTNSATSGIGGGIFSETATLINCTLSGNTAGLGGGISVGGTATLTNCTLTANSATAGDGGGIFSGGTLTLTDCALSGNSASASSGGGGGVFSVGGTATLTNCILASNSAAQGGGVYNGGMVTVTNCTLTANSAAQGGGVFNNATATLTNDIVYGDTGTEIVSSSGGVSTVTFSDIQGGYAGSGNINADPLFVSAASGNFHLTSGSPCLGAGTSAGAPTTDKDGRTRPNPPSIGAYEVATSHTHLLWNNTDGRVMLWSIAPDGTFTLNGFGPYTDNAPGNLWHATAVATGADGKSHLLWNNTDGRVMLWTVDDAGSFTLAGYGPYTDGAAQNKWSAVGVSVGPDNTVHLLWSNTDHRAMLWSVDSSFNFTLAGYGPYTDNAPNNLWTATALATGPDNLTRILWGNTDHRAMLWNVDSAFNFTLAGYGPYTDNGANNLWDAVGVSVGTDSLPHLLWGNTDRRAMFWDLDGSFNLTGVWGYGPYTDNSPGNLWSVTGLATGPDNMSHLLWNNTDNRVMLWGVDSAGNFTVAGYGPYTDNAPGNLWSATAVSAGP